VYVAGVSLLEVRAPDAVGRSRNVLWKVGMEWKHCPTQTPVVLVGNEPQV